MSKIVLDASALLVLLNHEPEAALVEEALPRAVISAINLSEVVAKLSDSGVSEGAIREAIQGLQLEVVPFDTEQAYEAGLLRPITKGLGLSLGDRGCLSLARRLGLPVLTTDRVWGQLSVGAEVRVIR